MKRLAVRLSLVVLATALCGGLWLLLLIHHSRATAEEALRREKWRETREQLRRYFWLHPRDAQARLMMAEALVRDDSLPAENTAREAIEHLKRIPDASPMAARARIQEGRLRFLVLYQPYTAEELLRKGIALEPQSDKTLREAFYLLWKLYDMTWRHDWAEEVVWQVLELTPRRERGAVLREWYLSQFFPVSASIDLDVKMGFLKPGEKPEPLTEHARLLRFAQHDRDAPAAVAALAQWYQSEGSPQFALKLLEKYPDAAVAFEDPYYVATIVAVLFDLGELERAKACFERWPGPRKDYEYWKLRGMILDEVDQNYEQALAAYDTAWRIWPGPADWRMQYRRAGCLAKLGRREEAQRERQKSDVIQELMETDIHQRLKVILSDLENAEKLQEVVNFYRKINRSREADAWEEYLNSLHSRTEVTDN